MISMNMAHDILSSEISLVRIHNCEDTERGGWNRCGRVEQMWKGGTDVEGWNRCSEVEQMRSSTKGAAGECEDCFGEDCLGECPLQRHAPITGSRSDNGEAVQGGISLVQESQRNTGGSKSPSVASEIVQAARTHAACVYHRS
jgi:hypothetical protein